MRRLIGSPKVCLRFGKGATGLEWASTGTSVELSSLDIE